MAKHRKPVEQEPGDKPPAEGEPRERRLGSKVWEWTGFGEKKLWEWLQLLSALAIPVVLTFAGFWFTSQQARHQQHIEERRAKAERKLEDQRAQDTALQAYLDQMGALTLNENLRDSKEGSEARTLARARTLTVLGRLDPKRKRSAIQFLYESALIDKEDPIVDLSNADLRSVDLRLKDLSGADLSEADLSEADLNHANLEGANLNEANMSDANLSQATLKEASLINADLRGADLRGATVVGASLTFAHLNRANLSNADLRGANLSSADLTGANLKGANMSGAATTGTNLKGTVGFPKSR